MRDCPECNSIDPLKPWKLRCETCFFRIDYEVVGKKLMVACGNGHEPCPP
jgi:hypothetical protein